MTGTASHLWGYNIIKSEYNNNIMFETHEQQTCRTDLQVDTHLDTNGIFGGFFSLQNPAQVLVISRLRQRD